VYFQQVAILPWLQRAVAVFFDVQQQFAAGPSDTAGINKFQNTGGSSAEVRTFALLESERGGLTDAWGLCRQPAPSLP
jgi:hypothetical protein